MMQFMASPEDTGMPRFPASFGDLITSVSLAGGICMALLERAWTGRGQLVDCSLITSATWCMSGTFVLAETAKRKGSGTSEFRNSGEVLDVLAGERAWGNKTFRTSDGEHLAFSCLDVTEQAKALSALGVKGGPGAEDQVRKW